MKLRVGERPLESMPGPRARTQASGKRPSNHGGMLFALLMATAVRVGAAAPAIAAEGPVVLLPPLTVSETLKTKPWKFVAVSGWEILSRCSDATTCEFIQRQYVLKQLLGAVVPPEFQGQLTAPATFLLSPKSATPALTWDAVADRFEEQRVSSSDAGAAPAPKSETVRFMPNLRLDDQDTFAVFAIIDENHFHPDRLGLSSDAIRSLLERRAPTLPRWLVAGVTVLGGDLTFTTETVEIAPFAWRSPAETEQLRRARDRPRTLLTMQDMFTGHVPSSEAERERVQRLWLAQAALFVRWALEEKAGGRREAFWNFVRRVSGEPVTEAVFQECFGMSFADMRDELSDYLPTAVTRPLRLRPEKLVTLDIPALRLATESEVVRIKGDWERLEVVYLSTRHPEFAKPYREQAQRTFQRAYEHVDRSPPLLAVIGLYEYEAGNTARARPLLEAAVQARVARPRIYLALAALRFAEARQQPEGPDGLLSAAQAEVVLEPLQIGYTQAPPLAEAFRLAAEVWIGSAAPLTSAQFALLEKGLGLFPENPRLFYQVALLNVLRGRRSEADALIARGLRIADENARARFEELRSAQAVIPAASPRGEGQPVGLRE